MYGCVGRLTLVFDPVLPQYARRAFAVPPLAWAVRFLGLPRTARFQLGTTTYRVSSTAYPIFSFGHYHVPRLFSGVLPRTASFCGSCTVLPRACASTTGGALEELEAMLTSAIGVG